MSRTLGVAGVQAEVAAGKDNLERMLRLLGELATLFPWVDVVLFSELCLCGLNPALAGPLSNPGIEALANWASREGKWLIPGSMYERDGVKLFNTSIVISPSGEIVARYRKLFPWRPIETSDPGDAFCVFDIPGKGRFGLCICYDQWFPEVIRTLAWMGAEAIIHPTATTTSDRDQELIISRAHAIHNQLFFLSVNGVGGGGNGRSIFVDPEGRVLQVAGQRETIMTEIIDLDRVRLKSVIEHNAGLLATSVIVFGASSGGFDAPNGLHLEGHHAAHLSPCNGQPPHFTMGGTPVYRSRFERRVRLESVGAALSALTGALSASAGPEPSRMDTERCFEWQM